MTNTFISCMAYIRMYCPMGYNNITIISTILISGPYVYSNDNSTILYAKVYVPSSSTCIRIVNQFQSLKVIPTLLHHFV